jgi:formate hydrogenlyase subunit 6/NADH:ubiquinone oxidoreductase subunit I
MGRRTNIFSVVSRNFRRRAVTLRFPDRPAPEGEFRGSVGIDTAKCLTCGICDYVCVSGAISVEAGESGMDWRYEPGRCTFCGRCVDHCPGDALAQEGDVVPPYARSGELSKHVKVDYPACPDCGRPARPFSERLLAKAYGEASDELRRRAQLCQRCRLREAQRVLLKGPGVAAEQAAAAELGVSSDDTGAAGAGRAGETRGGTAPHTDGGDDGR